ncbi:hypothetical protein Tco_0779653 [Tanacetum coccineum]
MPKSAWTEKDQIDNFLIERRLMRSLEMYSNTMIQPEPEGSTQGYLLDRVEVLSHRPNDAVHNPPQPLKVLERFNTTAGNHVKKILLKLNLSDHKSILPDSKEYIKMVMEVPGSS